MSDKIHDITKGISVGKLLLSYSIPSIISMLVVSLYNVIDRIFIGQGVGAIAISGLAITFPLMSLVSAIGTLVGVGGGARLSIVLGMKDIKWARHIVGNVLLLTFILSALLITPSYIFLDKILMAFGASEQTLPYAREYLAIVLPFTVFTNLSFTFSGLIRSAGMPKKSMLVILLGVVLNIILDPIFIFYFDMGIRGAALATVISMAVSAFVAVMHFSNRSNPVHFERAAFSLSRRIIYNIVSIGSAPFIMNTASCMVSILFNNQLVKYGGDLAVGGWGIINSYLMIIITVIIGLCMGMQPIVGFSFGAGNLKKMKDVVIAAAKVSVVVMCVGFITVQVMPGVLVAAFTTDEELRAIAVKGMRIVFLMTPVIGVQMIISNFCQSIGRVKEAIFMTLSRQVLFLMPLMYIFSSLWGLFGLWLAFPVSDAISTGVAVFYLNKVKKKLYR